jgi:hypothetical protein
MASFQALKDFERRFETMSVKVLKQLKTYWTEHAQCLAPKVRKQAMKRAYDIEKAIGKRSGIMPAIDLTSNNVAAV